MGGKNRKQRGKRKDKNKGGRKRPQSETSTRRPHEDSSPVLPEAALDAGGTTGQDREDGAPADSPGQGAPREVGSPPPIPVDEGGSGPTDPPRPPSQITRPYQIEAVLNPEVALAFSEWCQKQGGVTLGIEVADDYVGVADNDIGWHLRPSRDLTGQVAGQALRDLLMGNNPPKLIMQNIWASAGPLAHMLDVPLRQLLAMMVGDVGILLNLLNRGRAEPPYWSSPADGAYDAFVQHRHYAKGASSYYQAVSVIRAREIALWEAMKPLSESEDSGLPFTIQFPDLFLRVLGHFSREPVVLMALEDGKDPLAAVMSLLGLETEEQAMAVLQWTAIGFDTPALAQISPEVYRHLPTGGMDHLIAACEKHLPVLAMSFIRQKEDFIRDRRLMTLYGNPTGWTKTVTEAVGERYFRSVSEVLEVCAAAFWNDSEIFISGVVASPRQGNVNGGLDGTQSQWHDVLSQVGQSVVRHLHVKPSVNVYWPSQD